MGGELERAIIEAVARADMQLCLFFAILRRWVIPAIIILATTWTLSILIAAGIAICREILAAERESEEKNEWHRKWH